MRKYSKTILALAVSMAMICQTAGVLPVYAAPGDDSSGGGFEGGGSSSSSGYTGTASNTIDTNGTYSGTTYSSTEEDDNALLIDGATVTLDGITVTKTGDSTDTESGDFYGMNAALLALNGANVTISDATITSDAKGGNGVYSYGESVITISDSTIHTYSNNSGGVMVTGGGTLYGYDLDVTTEGDSAAAIRSDRGGGTIVIDGGSYVTNGYNSPAIYSTADITVANATLTATNSEALIVEGDNSITLTDCDVSGNMSDTKGASSNIDVHTVMIYQSQSGDADDGTSSFSMTGGSLTSNNGNVFYVTNTDCTIYLSDVDIINNETADDYYFLKVAGNDASNGWGTAGENGATVEFVADNQEIEGDIIVDTISTLNLSLTNGSYLTGTINIVDNEDGGSTNDDHAVVYIDSTSTWELTDDCYITSLENYGTIIYNGYTITLADGTVLSGDDVNTTTTITTTTTTDTTTDDDTETSDSDETTTTTTATTTTTDGRPTPPDFSSDSTETTATTTNVGSGETTTESSADSSATSTSTDDRPAKPDATTDSDETTTTTTATITTAETDAVRTDTSEDTRTGEETTTTTTTATTTTTTVTMLVTATETDETTVTTNPDENGSGTTTSTTTTTTDTSSGLCGDVTLDGNVNLADSILLSKYAAGVVSLSGMAYANGDVNDDGETDGSDALILLKYQVSLISSLPYTV